jgi:hypothetical protein
MIASRVARGVVLSPSQVRTTNGSLLLRVSIWDISN